MSQLKLPIKRKLMFGCYYTISASKGFNYNVRVNIKWYAWPFLLWKKAHEKFDIKLLGYPYLLWFITKTTIAKLVSK